MYAFSNTHPHTYTCTVFIKVCFNAQVAILGWAQLPNFLDISFIFVIIIYYFLFLHKALKRKLHVNRIVTLKCILFLIGNCFISLLCYGISYIKRLSIHVRSIVFYFINCVSCWNGIYESTEPNEMENAMLIHVEILWPLLSTFHFIIIS